MSLPNIVFSSTRGWNPGDEFIYMGVGRLLQAALGDHNPILFNRHPQIRKEKERTKKVVNSLFGREVLGKFKDNSLRDTDALDFADLVVFAGSPEWAGRRLRALYRQIMVSGCPVIYLGIGAGATFDFNENHFSADELSTLKNSLLTVVRDDNALHGLRAVGARYLPCPSLFSSPDTRLVSKVRRIGLVVGVDHGYQGIGHSTATFTSNLYKELAQSLSGQYEIEFVCHYIDDFLEAQRIFPGRAIHYSFRAEDYLDIYQRFDMVVSPRIHGIGLSTSMGIPGIGIAHDGRANTYKSFLAQTVNASMPAADVMKIIRERISRIEDCSGNIQALKSKTFVQYQALLQDVRGKIFSTRAA